VASDDGPCLFVCLVGSTGPARECSLCLEGKYNIPPGSASCTDCAEGKYSPAGSITNVCQACATNSASASANGEQLDCTCNSGYMRDDDGNCSACVAGKYKIATGDAVCTNCVAGQYSLALGAISDVCQTCPSNSDAVEASASCSCNSGSYYFLTELFVLGGVHVHPRRG